MKSRLWNKKIKDSFTTFLFIPFFGKIYLLELLSIFNLRIKNKHTNRLEFKIYQFLLIILLIYILIVDYPNYNYQTLSWFGTYILTYVIIYNLTKFSYDLQIKRLLYFLGGLSISYLIINDSFYYSQNNSSIFNKLTGAFQFLFIYLSFFSSKKWSKVIFILISLYSCLYLADRIVLISFTLTIPFIFLRRFKIRNIKTVYITLISVVFGIYTLSKPIIDQNFNKLNQKEKKQVENNYSNNFIANYIYEARPDILPMIYGIIDEPIKGYGSLGFDKKQTKQFLRYNIFFNEYSKRNENKTIKVEDRGVVFHSQILGSWLRYGLIGLVYQLLFLLLILKNIFYIFKNPPFINFLSIQLLLTTLFEPGRNRIYYSLFISILISYYFVNSRNNKNYGY